MRSRTHVFWQILPLLVISAFGSSARVEKKRIGIVGGGISGTSAAYFLHELLGDEVDIDLYNHGKLGGRLATSIIADREYEIGGSVIHPDNVYMVNFTSMLGLDKKTGSGNTVLGIYNGKSFDFLGSDWSFVTMAKLLWHYGLDILNIQSYIGDLMPHFKRIYTLQDQGQSFTKPEALLGALYPKFVTMMHHSIDVELTNKGYSRVFIDQLVQGGLLANYGQGTDIHGFVGAVSMAGIQPGLWSVHGGNRRIPEGLAEHSRANVIQGKVNSITLQEIDGQAVRYALEAIGDNGIDIYEEVYDYILIATPLNDDVSQIKFMNFPKPIGYFKQHYHRTVATMVQGTPNKGAFGLSDADEFPTALLLSNSELFYNSIGKHLPVDYEPSKGDIPEVYKVFSKRQLTAPELDSLFESYRDVDVTDWVAAYPHYDSVETDLPSFVLHDNLYYANAVEIIASSMEMCTIGARNCALLLYNEMKNKGGAIDAGLRNDQRDNGQKQEL